MKNKKREGKGVQVWPVINWIKDGAKYEGNFKNDEASGFGKFWHVDGDFYEGEWKNDKANGYGKYTHHVIKIFIEWSNIWRLVAKWLIAWKGKRNMVFYF